MFVFVSFVLVKVVVLVPVLDRGASVSTVMTACLPRTMVPLLFTFTFPFTFLFTFLFMTGAFWAPAIVHALANMIADEIRNFFDSVFVESTLGESTFVAKTFVAGMFLVPPGD